VLAEQVLARVQDPSAVFWDLHLEVYAALVEAINDLMLIIGRPTTIYSLQVTLNPRICWQPMPQNMLAITNIREIPWKTTLHTLDYTQSSWNSNWEADSSPNLPQRWAPLGMTYFIVHPAVEQATTVTVAGVGYPVQPGAWPPTGAETSPFHIEFEQALELYAASYLRLKEIGDDAAEGMELYKAYLQIAQRLSKIDDRRDSLVYSQAFGVPVAASRVTMR